MVAQLTDLHEAAIRRRAAGEQAGLFEGIFVGVVELVAMAMPFQHEIGIVGLRCMTATAQATGVAAEAHRAAKVLYTLLFREEADHRVPSLWFHFCRVCIIPAEHVAREFNHHHLQAEAETEVGNPLLACVLRREDLALQTALTEA